MKKFPFGLLIGFVGEDKFNTFIETNKYFSPLATTIIGLIPNCASSVLITELYVSNNIGFGALLSGLMVNAGLGVFYLARKEKNKKKVLYIILTMFTLSLAFGYIVSLIAGF